MRVLLVEDDPMIGATLVASLKDDCYAVDWVRNGLDAVNPCGRSNPDIVLLDLGLPGKDGLDVLRSLREGRDHVPVLIITARDGVEDRIHGLDAGADDYVLKPFEIRELLARMRALLRRKGGSASPELTNGNLFLDPVTREVRVGASEPILLSQREFALLRALMLRPGAILSRHQLEERIYDANREIEGNAVEFLIHSLRAKLGGDAIKNVRGVGWMVAKKG